ncbi:hypothetical protein QYF36_015697 [Acer negundo]|nr:hypothetical protein QYF36_015697 [Acer negundo]
MTKMEVHVSQLLDQLDPPVTTILADVDLFWTIWIGNCMNIQSIKEAIMKETGFQDFLQQMLQTFEKASTDVADE